MWLRDADPWEWGDWLVWRDEDAFWLIRPHQKWYENDNNYYIEWGIADVLVLSPGLRVQGRPTHMHYDVNFIGSNNPHGYAGPYTYEQYEFWWQSIPDNIHTFMTSVIL